MAEAVAEASLSRTPDTAVRPGGRAVGLVAACLSAAMFASSGPFGKPLIEAGWTAGSAVLLRIGLAAVVLALPAVWALRGQWGVLRERWRPILLYGLFGGAAVQVAFFHAIQYVPVAIALLMEYLGVVLVVSWVWWRTRRRPGLPTLVGMAVAIGGLVVVLDPLGAGAVDPRGFAWGMLGALGMAVYFVASAETPGIPPVAFVATGLGTGALALGLAGLVGLVPMSFSTADVTFSGATWPWWVPLVELIVVAAAAAYLLGFVGARRLGSTAASFVGLTEVLFAVLWAWVLLGEMPGPRALVGGLVLLVGVALVQWGSAHDQAGRTPAMS